MTSLAAVPQPGTHCPDTKPHGPHEWYGVPAAVRRECPGVPQPGDEPNDIEATGRCCCAGCIGMGPCDLDPPQALGRYFDDICRCGAICECGGDDWGEEYADD